MSAWQEAEIVMGCRAESLLWILRACMCANAALFGALPAPSLEAQGTSLVVGRVIAADSVAAPLAHVLVASPALGVSTRTDSTGSFRLPTTAAGPTVLRVVRLGFRAIEFVVELPTGDSLDLEIALEPLAASLPTVNVEARASGWRLRDFDDRRARGMGSFFDESEIARHAPDGRLTTLLRGVPGAVVRDSRSSSARYLLAGRGARPWSGSGPCYAAVIQDGIWVYRGGPGALPFNLNDVNLKMVRAIEYYRSTAQVPADLAGLGAECGVIVIWTI